jgi:hypothetical protein
MTTKQCVIDYRVANPKATLQQIGDTFGLSRERIRQILKMSGVPTRSTANKQMSVLCANCDAVITKTRSNLTRYLTDPRYKGNHFCDNYCKGKYAGVHYGLGKRKYLLERQVKGIENEEARSGITPPGNS